ncbi:BTB domain-containing protein [Phanerochaete sordida]|uniref:BTB domain-containing protein n=1 Tax=Phanerochaete sordida TaxID=48140 RepID=A0A9P3LI44_9APHY|nr:BTB domain-containing protein [Phanerochaete sordida]
MTSRELSITRLRDTLRHPTLYFANGDLVVSAESSDGSGMQLFRVHTVILAQHSPVFGDMLAIPAGPDGRETYDGAHVVRFPDTAEDVEKLFSVFYNPGFPLFKRSDSDFAVDVYGLMRIATKYQIDSICRAVKHHLECEWPHTVEELVRLHNDLKVAISRPLQSSPKPDHTAYKLFPEPASAIRLATDFDVPSILPAAYYILSTIAIEDTWDSTVNLGLHPLRRRARFELLGDAELVRYFRGKAKLAREFVAMYKQVLDPAMTKLIYVDIEEDEVINRCDYQQECGTALASIEGAIDEGHRESFEGAVWDSMHADPLMALHNVAHLGALEEQLCFSCVYLVIRTIGQFQKKMWDDLPKTFNLVSDS